MDNNLNEVDASTLVELFAMFPMMPSWMGRFFYVDIVVEKPEKFTDYGYADPAWVFSIDGYLEYKEYYDHLGTGVN